MWVASTTLEVVLCEWASISPDGTHTVIRGGIENWGFPTLPSPWLGWFFIRVPKGLIPQGDSVLKLEVETPNGIKAVVGESQFNFQSASGAPLQRLAANFQIIATEVGKYTFRVSVNDHSGTVEVNVANVAVMQKVGESK